MTSVSEDCEELVTIQLVEGWKAWHQDETDPPDPDEVQRLLVVPLDFQANFDRFTDSDE